MEFAKSLRARSSTRTAVKEPQKAAAEGTAEVAKEPNAITQYKSDKDAASTLIRSVKKAKEGPNAKAKAKPKA